MRFFLIGSNEIMKNSENFLWIFHEAYSSMRMGEILMKMSEFFMISLETMKKYPKVVKNSAIPMRIKNFILSHHIIRI